MLGRPLLIAAATELARLDRPGQNEREQRAAALSQTFKAVRRTPSICLTGETR